MEHPERPGDLQRGTEPATPTTVGDDPALVIRTRLLDRLSATPTTRLTVLRAPAGYGKTVLASRWVALRADVPVAWVSFRATDDARRMAARLLEGLASLGPTGSSALRASLPPGPHSFGSRFLQAIGQHLSTIGAVILVLDALDAPGLTTPVSELEHWATTLPAGVRAVVTRRSRPAVAPSTDATELTSIDAAELAFTAAEVRAVVERSTGVALTAEQVDLLAARTEGWPFAVRVAATDLLGQVDPDGVLRRLHGTSRPIEAILSVEVLQRASERVTRFLRRTSVLDSMSPGLCAAVVDDPQAGSILRMLERTGSFTGPHPDRPGEYRYHPLFRDLLRARLRMDEAADEQHLLRRAAEWYTRRGLPSEAARYATETGDPEQVVDLVDRFARTAFERGDPEVVLDILDAAPGGNRSDVALRRAYLLTMTGETRRAEQVLREVRAGPEERGLRSTAQALRATWVFFDADPRAAIDAADEALRLLRELDPVAIPALLDLTSADQLRAMAEGSRARALWTIGELEEARREMLAVLERPDLYAPWHVHLLSAVAILEAWAGNLRAGMAFARQAILLASRSGLLQHPATLDAHLAIATALLERDDLVRSARILDTVDERLQRFRRPNSLAMHTAVHLRHRLASGRIDDGLAAVRELRTSGEPPPTPIVSERLWATEARLLLRRHDLIGAEAAITRSATCVDSSLAAAAVHLAVARGDPDGAARHLATWEVRPSDLQSTIEHGLWTSIVAAERGDLRGAVQLLRGRVLPTAAFQGHRRVFLDAGEPCERVLRAVTRFAPSGYASSLLRSFDAERAVAGGSVAGLSERELEILRFLPTDLSSAEIADQLYISLNTLKTHLRTIYRKLEVGGRREAIQRAAALGLA